MTAPLTRPQGASVMAVRPLAEVLPDDAQRCVCRSLPPDLMCSPIAMRVTAADYTADGILL